MSRICCHVLVLNDLAHRYTLECGSDSEVYFRHVCHHPLAFVVQNEHQSLRAHTNNNGIMYDEGAAKLAARPLVPAFPVYHDTLVVAYPSQVSLYNSGRALAPSAVTVPVEKLRPLT